MWSKPWTMKEGTAICGALIVAGLLLEWVAGPVVWDALAFPVGLVLLSLLLMAVVVLTLLRNRLYVVRFMSTAAAAVPALASAVLLTLIMGLTRQQKNGTWINDMLTFWPFVLTYLYLTLVVGLAIGWRLCHLTSWRRDVPFLLNHVGIFVVLTCATAGSADIVRLKMICPLNEVEWRAADEHHAVRELPIAIELQRFIMEEYEDGTPRRFASEIQVYTRKGKNLLSSVDVNHPLSVEGWKIYQYGYDQSAGAMSRISVLELVRDPWLPAVYAGIMLMLLGALCMLFISPKTI